MSNTLQCREFFPRYPAGSVDEPWVHPVLWHVSRLLSPSAMHSLMKQKCLKLSPEEQKKSDVFLRWVVQVFCPLDGLLIVSILENTLICQHIQKAPLFCREDGFKRKTGKNIWAAQPVWLHTIENPDFNTKLKSGRKFDDFGPLLCTKSESVSCIRNTSPTILSKLHCFQMWAHLKTWSPATWPTPALWRLGRRRLETWKCTGFDGSRCFLRRLERKRCQET